MGRLNFSGAKIVIPVDGPAGSGKSTMAKAIADYLGWDYLETGALYRAVGLSVLDMGGNLNSSEEATFHAKNLNFECRKTSRGWRNYFNGKDATEKLRVERVSEAASKVSEYPGVRKALLSFQRSFGQKRGAVLDGRDIGTVVFPNARLKFFMDADIETRIQRRFDELREKGANFDPDLLGEKLRERDERDRNRKEAPLKLAMDAIRLDTTNLSIDEALHAMLEKVSREYGQPIDLV